MAAELELVDVQAGYGRAAPVLRGLSVSVEAGTPDGTVKARRRLVIHSSQEQQVEIPVQPPPFRILVTVSPTFTPADFGSSDTRQLGAELRFAYQPGARIGTAQSGKG